MSQEVYFKNIQHKIVELLESAKYSIKIAVAWFTDEKIIKIITKKQKEGINVSLLIFDDKINNIDLFYDLSKSGGKIFLSKKLMHNKFCILDEIIVINGSYNWTNSAKTNHENITVIFNSLAYTKNFLNEFNTLIKSQNSYRYEHKKHSFKELIERRRNEILENNTFPFFIKIESSFFGLMVYTNWKIL